eukprot:5469434-Heterocapsa_arctica.AAC.1
MAMAGAAERLRERVRHVVLGLDDALFEVSSPKTFLQPQVPDLQVFDPAWSALCYDRPRCR